MSDSTETCPISPHFCRLVSVVNSNIPPHCSTQYCPPASVAPPSATPASPNPLSPFAPPATHTPLSPP